MSPETSGFGYDPIFVPEAMGIRKKNAYSHRAKAFRAFGEWYKRRLEAR